MRSRYYCIYNNTSASSTSRILVRIGAERNACWRMTSLPIVGRHSLGQVVELGSTSPDKTKSAIHEIGMKNNSMVNNLG